MSKPFQNFYPAEDICKCKNKKCKLRFDCFRYMGKNTQWQSMTSYMPIDNTCEHFYPYIVWTNLDGKGFMLKDIDNDYLENIIKHLKERMNICTWSHLKDKNKLKEFKKLEKLTKQFISELDRRNKK